MASPMESVLLEDDRVEGKIRTTLFNLLHEHGAATKLRLCSRVLHDLVNQRKGRVFRECYFSVPLGRLGFSYNIPALQRIAPFCTRMTIKVMFGDENSPYTMGQAVIEDSDRKQLVEQRRLDFGRSRPPAGIARAMWNARNHFQEEPPVSSIAAASMQRELQSIELRQMNQTLIEQVLQSLLRITTLDIQINGDPGWPGITQVEDTLVSLRQALGRSRLPALRQLCFRPVHAAGIIHLRWAGFGAFCDQPFLSQQRSFIPAIPRAANKLWTKLAILDLHIRNPATMSKVGEKQMMMFFQVLEDYLRSFCCTLRGLHFVWLDAPGPSPLVFCDLLERERIVWAQLREFWYGNVTDPSLSLLPICMPHVKDLRALATPDTARSAMRRGNEWQAVQVPRPADHRDIGLLSLYQSRARPSQFSLVPAPLALPQKAAAVRSKTSSTSANSAPSCMTSNSDQLTKFDEVDIEDGNSNSATIRATPVASENQHYPSPQSDHFTLHGDHGSNSDVYKLAALPSGTIEHCDVPASRLPIASSIYSRDENGDYVPVRHKWRKSGLSSTAQQTQLSRGVAALLDAGMRLSTSLSDTRPPILQRQSSGRRPPVVSPPNRVVAKKNHIDLGGMPAYQAARSQYLRRHPEPALQINHDTTPYSSPKDHIRRWAQAVKSGRPPSMISAKSINTVNTTGSRPFSKFFANLRETGKPARSARS